MKRKSSPVVQTSLWTIALLLLYGILFADEGMWTFDSPPLSLLKNKYNFVPTPAWLDHLRLSSVRISDGGSGSFVSAGGLVLTNHHVALNQLQNVSTPAKDYVRDGFLAMNSSEELPCPDLEMNVLVSMENVTTRVLNAIKKGMPPEKALAVRKATIAGIEKESMDTTGLLSQVVALYQGGEYWLYRYKKYTEIKLVFAPEQQIAFFGGDPDNFTFPRHDLDMALFRVYHKGAPVRPDHYLQMNIKGAAPGDLVFVSGHPHSTDRLYTMAQLLFLRDHVYPVQLKLMKRFYDTAKKYASRGDEESRQSAELVFGLENGIKAMEGEFQGLKSPALMKKKADDEKAFRTLVMSNPQWKKAFGGAWNAIAGAIRKMRPRFREFTYRHLPGLRLGYIALQIVRYATEKQKTDGERLEGFHDSQLESLRFQLLSPAPVYPGLEEVLMADWFAMAAEELGPDDPFVRKSLKGLSPVQAAKSYIGGTALGDPAVRKLLIDGGPAAIEKSTDPLIALARALDPMLREMRQWQDKHYESIVRPAGEKIGMARFAVYGKNSYPDATFTLRLAFGTVKGFPLNGSVTPAMTTFYGLYDRSASFLNQPPYQLPKRYIDFAGKMDLATPLNFVSTCDIIGGNSGSPVVNREGELVGLIFDGNLESLTARFIYNEEDHRAVAVHAAAIIEAMNTIYGAGHLVKELLGK